MPPMEVSEWRNEVAYGKYLQPIHLTIGDIKSCQQATAAITQTESAAVSNLPVDAAVTSTEEASTPPGTPKQLKRRPKTPSKSPVSMSAAKTVQKEKEKEADTVHVIAPLTSEWIHTATGVEHAALNVGGPVWAMDWLSSQYQIKDQENASHKKTRVRKRQQSDVNDNANEKCADEPESKSNADENGTANDQDLGATGETTVEWKFLALSTHPPCEVVDGQVVRKTPPDHYYDVQEAARNLIQIWAVPVQTEHTTKYRLKPRLVYGIDHESGVAWGLQWCPLASEIPKRLLRHTKMLGLLAVCFGDGTLQIFQVPPIPQERLMVQSSEDMRIVERLEPIITGKLHQMIQLSLQWSPHHWHLILTGGSDGSVSLWNLEAALADNGELATDEKEKAHQIEPQRRFQDADTVGKQEAFEWGWGWVAIRAVTWSPFDEFIFVTTGNDSCFKVWDIREPRISLRSHRIRSTWGLSLQWLTHTCIQISGDQGSIYAYDILSGSYQKLHFHPQIDSPVWDLQLGRCGDKPLLLSACTSGSIRVAPAKKMYRAPQNSIEICRLSGHRDANIDQPFKALNMSFTKKTIYGTAESASPATREFCERDASLHRLRISTNIAGVYPCFLAAGGHAGLVIIMELQKDLDSFVQTHFLPRNKKIGRPKKVLGSRGGHRVPIKIEEIALLSGTKSKPRTLGSVAKVKGVHKLVRKSPGSKSKRKPIFPQFDMKSESEPEEEEDEDESESDASFVMVGDDSDDEHISISDDEGEQDEVIEIEPEVNPEDARLRAEYQLNLSEEDAMMLAIQMSEMEQCKPTHVDETSAMPRVAAENSAVSKAQTTPPSKKTTKKKTPTSSKTSTDNATKEAESANMSTQKSKRASKASKERLEPQKTGSKIATDQSSSTNATVTSNCSPSISAVSPQQAATSTPVPTPTPVFQELMIDQASALQMFEYQRGLTEEDALREAIRMSEMEVMRRSSRKKRSATQMTATNVNSRTLAVPHRRNPCIASQSGSASAKKIAMNEEMKINDAQRTEDGTIRRLTFSPDEKSVTGSMSIDESTSCVSTAKASVSDASGEPTTGSQKILKGRTLSEKKSTPIKTPKQKAKTKADEIENSSITSDTTTAPSTEKATKEMPPAALLSTPFITPPTKNKNAKRPASESNKKTGKSATVKRKKNTATPSSTTKARKQARNNTNEDGFTFLSEQEALLLALQTSEIEY